MKILLCRAQCNGPALMRTGSYGGPQQYHTIGSFPPGYPLKYRCRRCGQMQTITPQEFNRLPDMTEDQIRHASCSVTDYSELGATVN